MINIWKYKKPALYIYIYTTCYKKKDMKYLSFLPNMRVAAFLNMDDITKLPKKICQSEKLFCPNNIE